MPLTADDTEALLQPKISTRWAFGPLHIAITALWVIAFLLFNYMPLRGTDLWGHVVYGQWILQHGSLPSADPLMGLANGMEVVDNAWLSQVLFAAVEQAGGAEWLSNLFAVLMITYLLVLGRVFYRQTGSLGMIALGTLLVLVVGWSRMATIRPENFGMILFAVLLLLTLSPADDPERDPTRSLALWIGAPLIIALWANLHGSFVCGLALLGCFFAARVATTLWRRERIWNDGQAARWLVLVELTLLASLINPYGLDLLLNTLFFARNENLKDVLEWQPLTLLGVGGREFAASWVLLTIVLRHSRKPIPAAHVFLLGLFTLATVSGVRMISWYAPIFAVVLIPHLHELWQRVAAPRWEAWKASRQEEAKGAALENEVDELYEDEAAAERESVLPAGRSFYFSLICGLLVWCGFSLSGLSRPILGGAERPQEALLGKSTPIALTKYLRENPIEGQLFNPQWWGDWLAYDGPAGTKPFVTTNMHLVPRQVWIDYQKLRLLQPGWDRILTRYDVQAIVVDKEDMSIMEPVLDLNSQWQRVEVPDFEEQGVLYRRVERKTSDENETSPQKTVDPQNEAKSEEADIDLDPGSAENAGNAAPPGE